MARKEIVEIIKKNGFKEYETYCLQVVGINLPNGISVLGLYYTEEIDEISAFVINENDDTTFIIPSNKQLNYIIKAAIELYN